MRNIFLFIAITLFSLNSSFGQGLKSLQPPGIKVDAIPYNLTYSTTNISDSSKIFTYQDQTMQVSGIPVQNYFVIVKNNRVTESGFIIDNKYGKLMMDRMIYALGQPISLGTMYNWTTLDIEWFLKSDQLSNISVVFIKRNIY